MKQKTANKKKQYTVIKKRYIFLLVAMLVIALGANYHFIEYIHHETTATREESKDITTWTSALIDILADKWDAKEFLSRAHPLLLQNIQASGHSPQEAFAPLRALGKVHKENCVLVNYGASKNDVDHFAVATISCNPEYEYGTANVIIELKRDHLKTPWLVTAFTFDILSLTKTE